MGVGQFCTNPGLVFGLQGEGLKAFLDRTSALVKAWPPATMLHDGICRSFGSGVERLAATKGLQLAGPVGCSGEPAGIAGGGGAVQHRCGHL